MAYQDLGPLTIVGQSDSQYQWNPFLLGTGWDVLVSASTAKLNGIVLSGSWPSQAKFECYQISLDGPVGSSVQMYRNSVPWNYVLQGWQNYNDPQQALQILNGDEIRFAWNFAFTSPPYTASGGSNVRPRVTMWLRAELPVRVQV